MKDNMDPLAKTRFFVKQLMLKFMGVVLKCVAINGSRVVGFDLVLKLYLSLVMAFENFKQYFSCKPLDQDYLLSRRSEYHVCITLIFGKQRMLAVAKIV